MTSKLLSGATLVLACAYLLQRRQIEELRHRLCIDPLTKALTKDEFGRQLTRSIASGREEPEFLSVVFLDVNRFKEFNDKEGHLKGDERLARLCEIITSELRPGESSSLGRFGGDEFCIHLSTKSRADAEAVVERLRTAAAANGISISLGLATLDRSQVEASQISASKHAEELLDAADMAMYKDKHHHRCN